jgi:hypothetical protein
MYAGVPVGVWSVVTSVCRILVCLLDEPEIENLHEVVLQPHSAHVDIRRLDVPMNQPSGMCVRQRVAYLSQQKYGTGWGHGTKFTHQRFDVTARQQFHHVVETAIVGLTEIEEVDRVR